MIKCTTCSNKLLVNINLKDRSGFFWDCESELLPHDSDGIVVSYKSLCDAYVKLGQQTFEDLA